MRILEVHLEVADLERSVAFYEKLIPHEKLVRWPDGSAAALVLPNGESLGLWKTGKEGLYGGRGGRHVHFAFEIEADQYGDCKRRLAALGVEVIEHEWKNGERSLYFFDPDGHQGEFMTCDWLAL